MTRKEVLEERAENLETQMNSPTQLCSMDILEALLQVERECWVKVINKIETEMDKENESTDDQIWEIRDWCRDQLKEVEG